MRIAGSRRPRPAHIEDNIGLVTYITQQRIYDVVSLLLKQQDPADWEVLMKMHEQGFFATPGPVIAPEGE